MITPVILCGGSGTRLWPLSRKDYPKQFLSLSNGYSMFQETVLRLADLSAVAPPIVICNQSHRFIVAEQLHNIGIENARIILEPCGKNTAPAAAIAAFAAESESLLLVLPADHQIKNAEQFCAAICGAKQSAESGYLVTFGVKPRSPETGYGYIRKAQPLENAHGYVVEEFVEKPSLEVAKQYLQSGQYFWNSGIFMFRASVYLNELQRYSPHIVAVCKQAMHQATTDLDFIRIDETIFNNCPSDSIDYAVMEKSKQVAVFPLNDCDWSDMGSWDAIYDAHDKDQHCNVIKGDVQVENVTNSYLHAENRLLVTIGLSDLIVIETADAVLVAHKSASQEVKKIVNKLQMSQRSEIDNHRRIYRPWGYYETLEISTFFQVKRIVVKSGQSLSLQAHQHRSEHWIVIKGVAEVTCETEQFTLSENQSTYIPMKSKHRLRNPGEEPLIIIEVQTGSYLGEDDIVRYEDRYGRDVECIPAAV